MPEPDRNKSLVTFVPPTTFDETIRAAHAALLKEFAALKLSNLQIFSYVDSHVVRFSIYFETSEGLAVWLMRGISHLDWLWSPMPDDPFRQLKIDLATAVRWAVPPPKFEPTIESYLRSQQ